MFAPSPASISIPFRNVFVPKRGFTRVPYSSTTRPSAGHPSRPRIAPKPTPGGVLSPGATFGGFEVGGGNFRYPSPLLEVPNECLESPGGFAQLSRPCGRGRPARP
jgi:hypothetical protein